MERFPAEVEESVHALGMIVTANETVESTVLLIVEAACRAITSADDCSISLIEGRDIKCLGATSPVAAQVDRMQRELGEGPYLSAIGRHDAFYMPDTTEDPTWPRFASRVSTETKIRSLLSYVLEIGNEARGALNLLSTRVDAFDEAARAGGALFAAQAAVTLANAQSLNADEQRIVEMADGLETRSVIGQAVGITMVDHGVTADEAFGILKAFSQAHNVKMKEIATDLVQRQGSRKGS